MRRSIEYSKVGQLLSEEAIHVLREVERVRVVSGDSFVEVVVPGRQEVPSIRLLVGREAVDVHLGADLHGEVT